MPGEKRGTPVVIDLVRPRDLVWLRFTAYGATADGLLLTAGPKGATVVVSFASQHLGEQAALKQGPVGQDVPGDETLPDPAGAVPARKSRIALALAAGATITLTSRGLLAALRDLPMVVHRLAVPAASSFIGSVSAVGLTAAHLSLLKAAGLDVTNLEPHQVAAGLEPSPESPLGQIALAAQARRRLRDVADGSGGVLDGLLARGPRLGRRVRGTPTFSGDPARAETALEIPYRLVISPSTLGGWTHATDPVPGASDELVEVWHTRLGVRREHEDGTVSVDERTTTQRIVRALWARDRDEHPDWRTTDLPDTSSSFRMSLSPNDRHMLVRQSTETWFSSRGKKIADPEPIQARRLWLSAVGAFADLHGSWDGPAWRAAPWTTIESYDHQLTMGRDQYVRVAYPGYLFPFGHRATLVKITERRVDDQRAGLEQRLYLVINEPVRTYGSRDFAFVRAEHLMLVTPPLSGDPSAHASTCFTPQVAGEDLLFPLACTDWDQRGVAFSAPLLWVNAKYKPGDTAIEVEYTAPGRDQVRLDGQYVSLVASAPGGVDTAVIASMMQFTGSVGAGTSTPSTVGVRALVPATEQLAPAGEQWLSYAAPYLTDGFAGANTGQVWAEVADAPVLTLGADPHSNAGSGGFVSMAMPMQGLSRTIGVVGDVTGAAAGTFDPVAFLGSALPRLFGLVSLTDILEAAGVGLDDAPSFLTESLARVEALLADAQRLYDTVVQGVAEAERRLAVAQAQEADLISQGRAAIGAELTTAAQNALTQVKAVVTPTQEAVEALIAAVASVPSDPVAAPAKLGSALTQLVTALEGVELALASYTPFGRAQLESLIALLRDAAGAADVVAAIVDYAQGIGAAVSEGRFRFAWQPQLRTAWPAGSPVLTMPERGLSIAVQGQIATAGPPRVDVVAELRDFALQLPPGDAVIRLPFNHLAFRAGSSGKTEVDVVVGNLEFVGVLGFVEKIKQLIPFDGFSDPPYLDVSPSGVVAGFSLALPNVAVGMFALSNMALSADLRVPFLGDVVSVGFGFCTRDNPFNASVLCLGGGGWLAIRVSPRGLEVLELGLEAGATLAIDLGVASGSVSAMIGIYLRREAAGVTLTGYFRVRGRASVLGLASATIELYLALTYEFSTGKLVGEATITVKVKVLCFSKSVSISCRRTFAGSNGDPSFAEVMGVRPDHTFPAWTQYCTAFAAE